MTSNSNLTSLLAYMTAIDTYVLLELTTRNQPLGQTLGLVAIACVLVPVIALCIDTTPPKLDHLVLVVFGQAIGTAVLFADTVPKGQRKAAPYWTAGAILVVIGLHFEVFILPDMAKYIVPIIALFSLSMFFFTERKKRKT